MAEAKAIIDKLKEVASSVQKILECAVCLETIKVPFKICGTGHVICTDCIGNLSACPTCEEAFTLENPISLKNLIETLPLVCRYSDSGCKEVMDQGDGHEKFCGYRPIICREIDCNIVKPVCQLLEHYETSHPERFIVKEKFQYVELPDFKSEDNCHVYIPVFLFNNLFWILIINKVEEEELKIYFEVTPNRQIVDDYYVRVKFENYEFMYAHCIRASLLSSCKDKYGMEIETKEDESYEVEGLEKFYKFCMRVPQITLSHFTDIKYRLCFNCYFFKKNK